MIHFPLMPVSEPGELDPSVHMVVASFESPRAYTQWQTQEGLKPRPAKKYRMATYAECGEVLNEFSKLGRRFKELQQ